MNGIKRFAGVSLLAVVILLLAGALPAQAAGPFQYFAITPCRVVDTRTTTNAPAVAESPAPDRTFSVQGLCGVPLDAEAATLNVTVVSPTSAGWLGIYPSNVGFSGTSTINFSTGEFAIANGAIVPLAANAPDIAVVWDGYAAGSQTTHVVIDVTGYFKP